MTGELSDDVTRRSVLKTSAVTAGIATVAAAGAVAQQGSDEKRGGRAQIEGDAQRNRRFEITDGPEPAPLHASCMASESAEQLYLEYDIEYCNGDEDTLYVIPDEAHLQQDETYAIRATEECDDSDNTLIAFGPAYRDC